NVQYQEEIVQSCLARILQYLHKQNAQPFNEQVRTLRRLIYCHKDTLLIARTRFGKSIIFQTYSILTKLITLQIIPLDQLSKKQFLNIQRLPSSNPCLVTRKTKQSDLSMFQDIQNLKYTYILLRPEQASSSEFRKLLKTSNLQSNIGLVAINKCHLKNFRVAFTMLSQLQTILLRDVIWFGCSGTVS
ncbi:hypothetical protein B0O99DRAFT_466700, partial [Bisporella sp. PMI_857]